MILAAMSCSPAESDPARPQPPDSPIHTVGNRDDVQTATTFGLALVGGRRRCNEAYRWLIRRAGGGDFVFLTTAFYSDEEDERFFADMQRLGQVDSISTIRVSTRSRADAVEVADAVRRAELIFVDGGDQSSYYDLWHGTRLHQALEQVAAAKTVPLGGTSAGMAILTGLCYIPLGEGVTSDEALADPYHANMDAIRTGFIPVDLLAGILGDSHWSERNRCGRTIAFLARGIADGIVPASRARAIACDEGTAVCIDGDARAVVFGHAAADDFAYFLSCRSVPDRCLAGQSLHWAEAVSIWKLKGRESGANGFDLAAWQGWGGTIHQVNVVNGALSADIQTPK
jgi:cyanophycinase-like exopeptidase